jgi:hypothetical protein
MIRAGAVYFTILFCLGFLVVPLRVLLLQPSLGAAGAALAGAAVTIVVAWFAAPYAARRFSVPHSAGDRLGMGAIALLPFAFLEIALYALRGGFGPADWIVRALTTPQGLVGLGATVALWLMPLWRRSAG